MTHLQFAIKTALYGTPLHAYVASLRAAVDRETAETTRQRRSKAQRLRRARERFLATHNRFMDEVGGE